MEEKQELFSDIEKIKTISQLMGQQEVGNMDFAAMLDTAKKMKTIMNFIGGGQEESPPPQKPEPPKKEEPALKNLPELVEPKTEIPFGFSSKREKVLNAAIPFLDREYQKDLYVVVRLLEMKRVLGQGELLESRSKMKDDPATRRRKMLQAVRPYLDTSEKQKIDHIVKVLDMKQIMERKEEL